MGLTSQALWPNRGHSEEGAVDIEDQIPFHTRCTQFGINLWGSFLAWKQIYVLLVCELLKNMGSERLSDAITIIYKQEGKGDGEVENVANKILLLWLQRIVKITSRSE